MFSPLVLLAQPYPKAEKVAAERNKTKTFITPVNAEKSQPIVQREIKKVRLTKDSCPAYHKPKCVRKNNKKNTIQKFRIIN